jgi:hypothetical protein
MLAVDAVARARAVGRAWRSALGLACALALAGGVVHALGVTAVRTAVAGVSLAALAYAAVRMPSPARVLGAASIVAAAIVAAVVPPQAPLVGGLDGVQALHALLALAVIALARTAVPAAAPTGE